MAWRAENAARAPGPVRLGRRHFAVDELAVMAIVNRTPDSFFDQGAHFEDRPALEQVDRAVAEGAAIIDIGAVRAGPGDDVDTAEELRRVGGFVAAVRARYPDIVISVDTWRADVGRVVCSEGADLLNDAWQAHDPYLMEVAAEFDAGYVCTHAGGLPPRTDPHRVAYDDVVADVGLTVTDIARRAAAAGVRTDALLIDPAHDFGKNTWHSLEVSRRLDELVATGWPVLVALSNKKFLGETLDADKDSRLEATLAVTALAAWQGARFFRAHQVGPTRRALDTIASVRGTRAPAVSRRGLA
jgi:dihydropteroate synthase